ncbi:TPA_asm: RNA-directed RNA polymerase [ssRNA phage SRR7976299_3]|uniref:RNA-directed RNA polymerase n=1 Tax=ssRNA phage SRR7976299_3 TaxID=2786643 RepID=A0A8S5L1U4_9VIRU|nr:RNA-directed RNA polymerase [ssRNA phage SRR7976299_3]DAD51082.1 TPA_asm: RNA-directed RNA polymerase [ssRNA phage SRR7976299_3]
MKTQKLIEEVTSEENERRLRSFFEAFSASCSNIESPKVERQLARLRKKAQLGDATLKKAAIDTFLEANRLAGESSINLDAVVVGEARLFITTALERYFQEYIDSPQCEFSLPVILTNWKFGPGASRLTGDTHFFDKIRRSSGSVSARAIQYAILLRHLNKHLRRMDSAQRYKFKLVDASSMTTVPKNESTDRTICTEPLWNMALQLAAGAAIEGALRCMGLDISNQPTKNRRLAYIGSRDGELATIDLKMASDLITPALIKLLWPASWYNFLLAIRSEHTLLDLPGKPKVKLNMMSTMGNGFTFPMMTLTLLALVYASTTTKGRCYVDYSRIGVFGDDIICPSKCYQEVCKTLVAAGLIVNSDKSYSEGPFRESCGGDYYNGKYITPFYVKSLGNDAEVYATINAMLEWAWDLGDEPIPQVIKPLIHLVNMLHTPLLVPFWSQPTEGIRTITVKKNYYRIVPVTRKRRGKCEYFNADALMLAAIGGYVETVWKRKRLPGSPEPSFASDGVRLAWSPRMSGKTVWRLDKTRLPRGFLDGSTCLNSALGPTTMESWIDSLVTIVVARE